MPVLSRKSSSFGLSSKSSTNSISTGLFDRFRGFGNSNKKALEEGYRRPLTDRNVEYFVDDQRVKEACGRENHSMNIKIGFWCNSLPEACVEAIAETEKSMKASRPTIEGGIPEEDLPEGGSYSESLMAER